MTNRPTLRALLTAVAVFSLVAGAAAQTAGKDGRVADPAATPAAAAPPSGEAATAPARPQQPWILNCTNEATGDVLTCRMTQVVVARETNQRVISATIFRDPGTRALRLQLGLPHGLDLPAGISLSVDGDAPSTAVIRTADQNGSYSLVDIDEALLSRLKAGQILGVTMTSVDGRAVTLQLSLTGFSASVDRV